MFSKDGGQSQRSHADPPWNRKSESSAFPSCTAFCTCRVFTIDWWANENAQAAVGADNRSAGLSPACDWQLPQEGRDRSLNWTNELVCNDYSPLILHHAAHLHLSQPIYLLAQSRNTAVMSRLSSKVSPYIMTGRCNERLLVNSGAEGELNAANSSSFYFQLLFWEREAQPFPFTSCFLTALNFNHLLPSDFRANYTLSDRQGVGG